MSRDVTLRLFCSMKGGVGKSTLACATAELLAQSGRVPVVFDADITGTSLSDGLSLRAPMLKTKNRDDFILDLTREPTNEWLSVDESAAARDRRGIDRKTHEREAVGVPFLNDALFFRPDLTIGATVEDCRIDSMLWQRTKEDGVLYLPSSPLLRDIELAVTWLNQPEYWEIGRRMAWIIDGLLKTRSDVTDVILDLPPGIHGFSVANLWIAQCFLSGRIPDGHPEWENRGVTWSIDPCFVCSQDLSDLFSSLESFVALRRELKPLRIVLNRHSIAITALRSRIKARYPNQNFEKYLTDDGSVGEYEFLSVAFAGGGFSIPGDEKALRDALVRDGD